MHIDLDKEFAYELESIKRMQQDKRIYAYRVNWGTLCIWVRAEEGDMQRIYWSPSIAMESHFPSEADVF